jgi:hypothetical protein
MTFDGLAAAHAWMAATVLLQVTTLAQALQVVWVVIAPVRIFMVHNRRGFFTAPLTRPWRFQPAGTAMSGVPARLIIWHFLAVEMLRPCSVGRNTSGLPNHDGFPTVHGVDACGA